MIHYIIGKKTFFFVLLIRRDADVDTDVEGISVQDSSEARLIKKIILYLLDEKQLQDR